MKSHVNPHVAAYAARSNSEQRLSKEDRLELALRRADFQPTDHFIIKEKTSDFRRYAVIFLAVGLMALLLIGSF